ncbi:hypothetical protein QE382_004354 [Sphingobacterium zeae]|uniref:Uncharacterized protein n=1 Tax=Sphingobacterium zeae TaxID=1776859 RepID=A0ABU0UBY9_9SPHI|nr:hypothetical protein [Sphingobacterium zeae]
MLTGFSERVGKGKVSFLRYSGTRSHKNQNDYENETNKHHPSPAFDQRQDVEVFSQITFKEHIPRTRIGCAPSKTGYKEQ